MAIQWSLSFVAYQDIIASGRWQVVVRTQARLTEVQNAIKKLDQKFLKKLFWDPGYFKNMEIYEREVARFKNA